MAKSKQFRKKYGGSSRRPVKPKAGQTKTLKQRAEELGARIKSSAVARASHVGTRKKSASKSHKPKNAVVPEVVPEIQRRITSLEQRRARRVAEEREAREEQIEGRRVLFEPQAR